MDYDIDRDYIDSVHNRLMKAGLENAEVVSTSVGPAPFGNAHVVFRLGPLLLRFVRDRSQEFLDLASRIQPALFHQFDNVDIAMGWKSIDQVLAKQAPEDLDEVLARVKANLRTLFDAFSRDRESATQAAVKQAAKERSEEYMSRLRAH